jgi:hypothetical protein
MARPVACRSIAVLAALAGALRAVLVSAPWKGSMPAGGANRSASEDLLMVEANVTRLLMGSCLLAASLAFASKPPQPAAARVPPAAPVAVRHLNWQDLLPADERAGYRPGPPPAAHDYLNRSLRQRFGGADAEFGKSKDSFGVAAEFGDGPGIPAIQSQDIEVNKDLEGAKISLPGYVVPLDMGPDGAITEFFLAAYLGACIHVPPPPPNQMVYVKLGKDFQLTSVSDAYLITGVLHTQSKITGVGAAAYSMDVQKIEIYRE